MVKSAEKIHVFGSTTAAPFFSHFKEMYSQAKSALLGEEQRGTDVGMQHL